MKANNSSSACAACGRALPSQQGRGRRRQYCDATCRSAGRRQRERSASTIPPAVKAHLTPNQRQDYLDVVGAAGDPAGLTADRIVRVAGQLAAQLTQPGSGSPLAQMASARELATVANAAMQTAVDRARAAGHSWKEIGDVLETTRQAAFQRFGRPVDPRTGEPMTRTALPGAAERAIEIFANIAAGQREAARADFGPKMLEGLSASRLGEGWVRTTGRIGRYEGMGEPFAHALGEHTIVDIPLHFEAGEATGRVTFDADGKVVGLFIRPAAEQR
jgi:Protein of unknown function (DUF3887)